MISGYAIHRINNVAARVVHTPDSEVEFYHPDCLAEEARQRNITDDDVSIDHEYCGGNGRFTRYDDLCEGCGELLGDSGGVQPEDEEEDEDGELIVQRATEAAVAWQMEKSKPLSKD